MIDFTDIWYNLPFPAFAVDHNDCVVQGNSEAEQITQTSLRQMIGKPLSRFFGQETTVLDTLQQAHDKKTSIAQYGVTLTTVSRTTYNCDLHVRVLDTENDFLLLIIQPTGNAQKLGQSLNHRTAARSVTAMASMLAHEIRNPLAGISGAAQLLAMNSNADDAELAALIEEESKRIGRLVDRFEHFSDTRSAIQSPLNIHDLIDRSILVAQAGFGEGIRFIKDYDPSLPEVAGDADQLAQVFQNLLKNASEAIEKGLGQIRLRTSYDSGVKFAVAGGKTEVLPLQIEIIDNGKGIPSHLITDIFEPFVSTKVNGTGLGLSLVSKIISGHGGLLECTSDDAGTRMVLRLPMWKQHDKRAG